MSRFFEISRFAEQKPFYSIVFLFLICLWFRIADIFILRLDESFLHEIIISKMLGTIAILLFLRLVRSNLKDIGLGTENIVMDMLTGLLLAVISVLAFFCIQLLLLHLSGLKVLLVQQRYSLLIFIISVLIGNLVNAFMEEALFRGIMMKELARVLTVGKANFIQAAIFGAWHLVWPLKDFFTGKFQTAGEIYSSLLGIFLITMLMGYSMGSLFYKSHSLWLPFVWHFIMNASQNLLTVKSRVAAAGPDVIEAALNTSKGLSFVFVFIVLLYCARFFIWSKT